MAGMPTLKPDVVEGRQERQAAESLDLLAKRIGKTNQDHGFRGDFDDAEFLEQVAQEMEHISSKVYPDPVVVSGPGVQGLEKHRRMAANIRKVADKHRMLAITAKLMLVVSELSESLEAIRESENYASLIRRTNFPEEIADSIIRLLDLADMTDIKIGEQVDKKALRNVDRPHMHGKNM